MLQEQHRVLAPEGGAQQPHGVAGPRTGMTTMQPRDVGEDRLAALASARWRHRSGSRRSATRITMGQVKAPLDRQRMVAASLLICCMAGQM